VWEGPGTARARHRAEAGRANPLSHFRVARRVDIVGNLYDLQFQQTACKKALHRNIFGRDGRGGHGRGLQSLYVVRIPPRALHANLAVCPPGYARASVARSSASLLRGPPQVVGGLQCNQDSLSLQRCGEPDRQLRLTLHGRSPHAIAPRGYASRLGNCVTDEFRPQRGRYPENFAGCGGLNMRAISSFWPLIHPRARAAAISCHDEMFCIECVVRIIYQRAFAPRG